MNMNRKIALVLIASILTAICLTTAIYTAFESARPEPDFGVFKWKIRLDCYVYKNGVFVNHHPMTITNQGKDSIADRLFTSSTQQPLYISVSNDTSSFSASWTALPNVITDGGLAQALGTWTDTGVGTGNITKTFSVTATRTTRLYGVGYNSPTGLIAAEQQTPTEIVLHDGDTLTVTIMYSSS